MKLLLADDHTLFRDALVQYLSRAEPDAEISIAKDLYQVFDLMEAQADQDLVLLDLRMPGMNGIDGFKKFRDIYPDIKVGLMSGIAEPEDVQNALDAGAIGYFPKTMSGKALLKAIQLAISGERFVPINRDDQDVMPSYYDDAPSRQAGGNEDAGLTPREADVLSHLLEGASNKEIARELNLQVVTVKLHIRGICRKLNAKNRTQAALKAHEMGLIRKSS